MSRIAVAASVFLGGLAAANPKHGDVQFPFFMPMNFNGKTRDAFPNWSIFETYCFQFIHKSVGMPDEANLMALPMTISSLCRNQFTDPLFTCPYWTDKLVTAVTAKVHRQGAPYSTWCGELYASQTGEKPRKLRQVEAIAAKKTKVAQAAKTAKFAGRAGEKRSKAHPAAAQPTSETPATQATSPAQDGSETPKKLAKPYLPSGKVIPGKVPQHIAAPSHRRPGTQLGKRAGVRSTTVTSAATSTTTTSTTLAAAKMHSHKAKTMLHKQRRVLNAASVGGVFDSSAKGLETGIEGMAIAGKLQTSFKDDGNLDDAEDIFGDALAAASKLGEKKTHRTWGR